MENRYATSRSIAAILMLCLCLSACAAPAGTAVDIMPAVTSAPLSSAAPALSATNAAVLPSPSPEIVVQNEQMPAPETAILPLPTEQPSPAPAPQTPKLVISEAPTAEQPSLGTNQGDNANMKELLHQLQTLTSGVDYAENELLSSFPTENEARDFAARFELELIAYTPDFTLLRSSDPLLDAVQRMMAESGELPILSLNYQRTSGIG